MRHLKHLSILFAAACNSVAIASCSTSGNSDAATDVSPPPQTETGTVSLPLEVSASGNTYRLSLAFYIYGYTSWYYSSWSTSAYTSESSFRHQLSAGDYQIYLQSYQVYRLDPAGSLQAVSARLVTPSSQTFSVQNNTTTTIDLGFETDGITLHTGVGNVAVTAHVTQVAPVCTLLGTDCGSGYWCPPPELTGRTLACVATSGQKALGQSCLAPNECQANSSCFDFGAGPACSALCLSSDFGLPCSSGGTCVAQGTDYGVCVADANVGVGDAAVPNVGASDGEAADGGATDGG